MGKSSTLVSGLAHELLDVQPVNGLHSDIESQSNSPIVYASRAMGEIVDKIERLRDSQAPVLITGETGVGKELIAAAVHAAGPRHGREFIPFNCGDVGPELIASELFGHRRGAFTGADRNSTGVIREADSGSLFLDEIGELPLAAQATLLRFLQKGEVRPLGEARPIKVDVRVIAATNRDLEADFQAGRFRADLFWRLNTLRLRIPPLRERREDIPILVKHFLRNHARKMRKQGLRLNAETWKALLNHDWPGNVRELENAIYRLVVFAKDCEEIGPDGVLEEMGIRRTLPSSAIVDGRVVIDLSLSYRERVNELDRLSIISALNDTGGNISRASTRLGICRNALKGKIKRFRIDLKKLGQMQSR